MPDPTTSAACLSFLTVMDLNPHGLLGGFLVLNLAGRPLEFHCTVPMKPSRAQQILYGPTLEPFLYGEQIGAALVRKATRIPLVVLIDQPAALAVREHIDLPTAIVAASALTDSNSPPARTSELLIGDRRLFISNRFASDRELIAQRLTAIDELFDLSEPFGRIREAIEEAYRSSAQPLAA
jgi:hypothetical protein